MTPQILNLIAAWAGALAGLAIVPHLPNEAMLTAAFATILIVYLSHGKHRRPVALTLCSLLGLACTHLTVSLVS